VCRGSVGGCLGSDRMHRPTGGRRGCLYTGQVNVWGVIVGRDITDSSRPTVVASIAKSELDRPSPLICIGHVNDPSRRRALRDFDPVVGDGGDVRSDLHRLPMPPSSPTPLEPLLAESLSTYSASTPPPPACSLVDRSQQLVHWCCPAVSSTVANLW